LDKKFLFNFPWIVLAAALGLTLIGLAGIYSTTLSHGQAADSGGVLRETPQSLAEVQLTWLLVSLAVCAVVVYPSYTRLADYGYLFYFGSLLLLVILCVAKYLPGGHGIAHLVEPRNHAFCWFQIPGTKIALEPSEVAKIAFIMALAQYLRHARNYRTWTGLVPPFLMALVPTLLILAQPALGMALMYMPVLVLMLLAAGARVRHLALVALVIVLLTPVLYLKVERYQQRRVDQWLLAGPLEDFHLDQQRLQSLGAKPTPEQKRTAVAALGGSWRVRAYLAADYAKWWTGRHAGWLFGNNKLTRKGFCDGPYHSELDADPAVPDSAADAPFRRASHFVRNWLTGTGYQPWQAKVAVGSGGLTGEGFGAGSQTQYGFLPEAQNDYIYAVIAEEWGFIGAAVVLLLYLIIVIFGVDVGLATNEPYGKLLAVGLVAMITAQAFLNMAITVGLTPVTGITLPFMSYGGSSLVASYVAIGLLCNIGMRRYVLPAPTPFTFRD
jgi:cell division protein FtsW (lipid II flippase)